MAVRLQTQAAPNGAVFLLPDGRSIIFDVTTNEDHRRDSLITDHPSQSGVSVSDNTRRSLKTIPITCYFTDTPFGLNEDTPRDRSIQLYNELVEVYEAGTVFDAVLALEVHESVQIQSISAPYTPSTGAKVEIGILLKERRIVNALTVDAPELERASRASNTETPGTQQGNEAGENARGRASYLSQANSYIDDTQGVNIAKSAGRGLQSLIGN